MPHVISVTEYRDPSDREEHHIKIPAALMKELGVDPADKHFLAMIAEVEPEWPIAPGDPHGGKWYEAKIVHNARVASFRSKHQFWSGDEYFSAYNITRPGKIELIPAHCPLPLGEYFVVLNGGSMLNGEQSMILQPVVEETLSDLVDIAITAHPIKNGIVLKVPEVFWTTLGFKAGDRAYFKRHCDGDTLSVSPGSEKGDGRGTTINFPFTKIIVPYPDLSWLPRSDFTVPVAIQPPGVQGNWIADFNMQEHTNANN